MLSIITVIGMCSSYKCFCLRLLFSNERYSGSPVIFVFQAEDGIRDLVRSRGLGDVYKRQGYVRDRDREFADKDIPKLQLMNDLNETINMLDVTCLLYTSDAADERSSVDLGGRRIIKKKKSIYLGGGGPCITKKLATRIIDTETNPR